MPVTHGVASSSLVQTAKALEQKLWGFCFYMLSGYGPLPSSVLQGAEYIRMIYRCLHVQ